jgi:hypothetical protein
MTDVICEAMAPIEVEHPTIHAILPHRRRLTSEFQNMDGISQRFLQIHRKQHRTRHHRHP